MHWLLERPISSFKINKQELKSIIKPEEISSSQSELWMSLQWLKPTKTIDCCMTWKADSLSLKSKIVKPNSNCAKLKLKPSDQTKSHMLLPMTQELLDSHTQTSVKEIQLNTTLKKDKSFRGLKTSLDIWHTWLVVTTSVELEQSYTLKDI